MCKVFMYAYSSVGLYITYIHAFPFANAYFPHKNQEFPMTIHIQLLISIVFKKVLFRLDTEFHCTWLVIFSTKWCVSQKYAVWKNDIYLLGISLSRSLPVFSINNLKPQCWTSLWMLWTEINWLVPWMAHCSVMPEWYLACTVPPCTSTGNRDPGSTMERT